MTVFEVGKNEGVVKQGYIYTWVDVDVVNRAVMDTNQGEREELAC